MRVLIITQYFHPENFKSNDIAFELAKRGHHVDALVGIPNFPEGKYYKGYSLFRKRKEIVNNVNIYRAFQTPRGKKASALGLSLNYCTYMISACLWVFFSFLFKKKYDAIIVVQLSPITQAVPAILLGKIKNIPVYTWVLDIWPDSVISTIGRKRSRSIEKPLMDLTEWVYRCSRLIMVSSKGMIELVNRNHDYSNKILYFPNWCDDITALSQADSVKLPEGFIIMMAGNLNDGIGPDSVVELVDSLRDVSGLYFVFVGGGAKESYLRERFEKGGYTNVVMTGKRPFDQIPSLYAQADAMLLTLKKTDLPHLKATVPARLQSYMAAGKPVIAMIDGCCFDLINTTDCGYATAAGDVGALASYIKNVIMKSPELFKEKGKNARVFFEQYYQKHNCISNLEYYIKGEGYDNPPFPVPNL
jgi:glycosyltransferase involved in cell wall biosynthesis